MKRVSCSYTRWVYDRLFCFRLNTSNTIKTLSSCKLPLFRPSLSPVRLSSSSSTLFCLFTGLPTEPIPRLVARALALTTTQLGSQHIRLPPPHLEDFHIRHDIRCKGSVPHSSSSTMPSQTFLLGRPESTSGAPETYLPQYTRDPKLPSYLQPRENTIADFEDEKQALYTSSTVSLRRSSPEHKSTLIPQALLVDAATSLTAYLYFVSCCIFSSPD